MEVIGPQMVLTMRLTTFACRRKAGVRLILYLRPMAKRSRVQELDNWQLSKCITQYPSILEFLGYYL